MAQAIYINPFYIRIKWILHGKNYITFWGKKRGGMLRPFRFLLPSANLLQHDNPLHCHNVNFLMVASASFATDHYL